MAGSGRSNRLSDSGIQSGPPRDRDLLRLLRPQARGGSSPSPSSGVVGCDGRGALSRKPAE
jgi:hypothetical protein